MSRFCVSSLIGINEYSKEILGNDLLIYPNPTDNSFTLEPKFKDENGSLKIQIYNILGELVSEKTEKLNPNSKFTFNTSQYQKGVYLIKASTLAKSYNTKLVIQ